MIAFHDHEDSRKFFTIKTEKIMTNPSSKMLHTYKSKCEILRNYNSLLTRQSSHFVCTHKCNFSVLFHVKNASENSLKTFRS